MKKYGPSTAEKKLFYALHELGLDAKLQYPISKMHVDIAFPKEKLAIEVNGPHHNKEPQKTIDKKRWYVLRREGWKRRSYKASWVHDHPERIAQLIKKELDEINGEYQKPILQPREYPTPQPIEKTTSDSKDVNLTVAKHIFLALGIVNLFVYFMTYQIGNMDIFLILALIFFGCSFLMNKIRVERVR